MNSQPYVVADIRTLTPLSVRNPPSNNVSGDSKQTNLLYSLLYKVKRSGIETLDMSQFTPRNLVRICMFPKFNEDAENRVNKISYDEASTSVLISQANCIKIVPKFSCKAEGLRVVLGQLGRNLSEVMAFGDGDNDISMLSKCGFGVAVQNCQESVISHSNLHLQRLFKKHRSVLNRAAQGADWVSNIGNERGIDATSNRLSYRFKFSPWIWTDVFLVPLMVFSVTRGENLRCQRQ